MKVSAEVKFNSAFFKPSLGALFLKRFYGLGGVIELRIVPNWLDLSLPYGAKPFVDIFSP
ncbi:MAG: hypothetical protein LBI30_00965 [Holosporales bacterium]|jgi:hypothetical protein|nr:hypothetical protein [Holosporales bacterium]